MLIHSFIGTIVFIITNKNENFATYYAIGIIGCVTSGFCYVIKLIKKWWFNHSRRSIFEDENGNRLYCEIKYANDFDWHYNKWTMINKYAIKDDWKDLTPFTKEQIELAKRNCDRCKYDDCTFDIWRKSLDKIKCKHDAFGIVTEFDKFEKKIKYS